MLSAFVSCVVSGLWGGEVRSGSLLWTVFFRNLFLGCVSRSGRGFVVGPGPVEQGLLPLVHLVGVGSPCGGASSHGRNFSEWGSNPLPVVIHGWLSLRYSI